MINCSITENYLTEKARMTKRVEDRLCNLGCSNCPLCSINNNKGQSCTAFEMLYPEKAIATVQKWSDEHPQKTYLSEFLKNYPKVQINSYGIPKSICPSELGLISKKDCANFQSCVECWNQPLREGEE